MSAEYTVIGSEGFGLVLVGIAGLVFLVVGFFFGKRFSPSESVRKTAPVEVEGEEEVEDPTAPIAPMIEMARSPHDRHRDLSVGRSLVQQIDFLESMIKAAVKKGDSETEGQLQILRKEFLALLGECSVEAFEFASGTVIDSDVRSRIRIVGGEVKGERSVVAETVQCGYLYLHGDEDTMIIRKAEIRIG